MANFEPNPFINVGMHAYVNFLYFVLCFVCLLFFSSSSSSSFFLGGEGGDGGRSQLNSSYSLVPLNFN